eukprot:11869238-Alexandrium_andersonii.AAC.1
MSRLSRLPCAASARFAPPRRPARVGSVSLPPQRLMRGEPGLRAPAQFGQRLTTKSGGGYGLSPKAYNGFIVF